MLSVRRTLPTLVRPAIMSRMMSGGDAGSIREAGGAFGKKEKAVEDQYFRKQQAEQLKNLVDSHAKEIQHHKEAIQRHQEAMKVHEEALKHH
ncbi:hypothetical protein TCAL_04991 [Tigriopus californicus]|uniref:ATPase inhibitor, mitochondrial n=1 Tax=Tigriopus californicus TaxID=6832 RepID=A0A553PD45_TIGCA|nr:ATPase inhibitor, mitochondrial-like [Tigriopus californicus]TRY75605.1 hypothetical protein TCAL_04991 [Tigriopus californicus]